MEQIVGPGSMLAMIISSIRQDVYYDPTFFFCPSITAEMRGKLAEEGIGLMAACDITVWQVQDYQA